MRFLALWFLIVHPLTVNVGFHVLFSTTSPVFKSDGIALAKVRSMYVSLMMLIFVTVFVSALAGDGYFMNQTSSPGGSKFESQLFEVFQSYSYRF